MIEVFDVLGSKMQTIEHHGKQGDGQVKLSTENYTPGIYLVKLTSDGVSNAVRMVVAK